MLDRQGWCYTTATLEKSRGYRADIKLRKKVTEYKLIDQKEGRRNETTNHILHTRYLYSHQYNTAKTTNIRFTPTVSMLNVGKNISFQTVNRLSFVLCNSFETNWKPLHFVWLCIGNCCHCEQTVYSYTFWPVEQTRTFWRFVVRYECQNRTRLDPMSSVNCTHNIIPYHIVKGQVLSAP